MNIPFTPEELREYRAELSRLSGSGKRVVSTRRHGLYCSINLPGFDDMRAVRDTKIRFDDFGIPANLGGKTFLDLGSNTGAMALEAATRGAKVVGAEFREDRVKWCNDIAARFKLDAEFYQSDFNELIKIGVHDRLSPSWTREPFDMLLCSSVDEYINDLDGLHDLFSWLLKPGGVLYYESNIQDRSIISEDIIDDLTDARFTDVEHLGNGHSGGIQRRRILFRAVRRSA